MALISAADLLARLGSPDLRLADVRWYLGQPGRGREEYGAGHLPGAVFLDLETDLSAPTGPGRHPLPDPVQLAARLGEAGFGDEDLVVAYDDQSGMVAARLWWMLDSLGHRDAAVLDGGIRAWLAAGGQIVTDVLAPEPARLGLAPTWPRVLDRGALVPRLGSVDLLDLRAGERYRGEVEPIDPVAGHIPTARSLPAALLLDPDGRLLPPDTLAERLALPEPGFERVMSCGSGVTACLGALAHRVAGLPDPLIYAGSYSDWSRSGMPVATGPEPGTMPRD